MTSANLIKINTTPTIKLSSHEEPVIHHQIASFIACDEYFTMYGQEMYPVYQPGQVMMCKELIDWDFIPFGNAFLVVTDSMRLVRYVKKSSCPDSVKLVSENSHFDTFEIPKSSIKRLYIVTATIKRCGI
ncbi:S24 family peptidase [Dyadobacter koreensis]|uniref:S24 family peptidase n=1 Tax=Dyadobacter koreensis TaxID=408657 RepID=UPI000B82E45D|nr:S24 family peptidase [Dyadobacter koreensis]